MVAGKNLIKALIMGPPGSGKGTIAKRIIKDFGMKHIASGDVLRRQIALKTDVGVAADKYIKAGDLVPDEVMTKLILTALESKFSLKFYFYFQHSYFCSTSSSSSCTISLTSSYTY